MKRMVQRNAIATLHEDGQHAQHSNVRNSFLKVSIGIVQSWSCDDKDKVKSVPPSGPCSLAALNVKIYVPRNKDHDSLDYSMGIATLLTPSVQLNVTENCDNKLGSFYQVQLAL